MVGLDASMVGEFLGQGFRGPTAVVMLDARTS